MCVVSQREEEPKREPEIPEDPDSPTDYSHIFTELEAQLIVHRALLMQRLVQDPFYIAMNVSTAARLWMLRHLAHLAKLAERRYGFNLLQFFEIMGREEMIKYLRYKNAPPEMVALWNTTHPAPEPRRARVRPAPQASGSNATYKRRRF